MTLRQRLDAITHPTEHLSAILTLPTVLRIMGAAGVCLGLTQSTLGVLAGLWLSVFGNAKYSLNPGLLIGGFIADALFNALTLMFVALIGYWPYRLLAGRRRFGLHKISLHPLPEQD